ncbi:ubiquitin-conjugating enzyme/RWD-like protein [Spinellus fusiger]|nr:ubiquitin-conjugating enzyme/RWD-like protein [Spinellus fusiger]
MTDYIEEQQIEIEALESIYPEEFNAISAKEFSIAIQSDDVDGEPSCILSLHVTYTPNYPDELPEYTIEEVATAGEDCLGMAMIFTFTSIMKEELNRVVWDAQRTKEEAALEKKRKEEEIEHAKFRGTKLTVDRFMEWRVGFNKEMEALEDKEKIARMKEIKNRLNGRQLFEQDKSLALSDAKFMEEGDISVDVSQFEKEERVESDTEDDSNAVWKRLGNED